MSHPTSGRGAEAARNDEKILDAARRVFLADPTRPIAAVASEAGVGISALYRRYPSKEVLLRELAADGLARFNTELERALASAGDAWTIYCDCLQRVLEGRSQALAQRLAGTFTPTPALYDLSVSTGDRYAELHQRTQRAGALRPDVTTADVVLLLEMLSVIDMPGPGGGDALRRRYLTLMLQSLHASNTQPLPTPPASDGDLAARWSPST
ncbi:MAG: helix-turn-helix domain-containing protein [Ornithinimicrobium sp.]